jgi:hypothetical protein
MAPVSPASPDLALYVGPPGNSLGSTGGITELIPHVTVCEVSRSEAEGSDFWQPVAGSGKPKAKRARKAKVKAPVQAADEGSAAASTAADAAGEPVESAAS